MRIFTKRSRKSSSWEISECSTTENILESLKQKVKENHIKKPDECKELLIESIKEQMQVGETAYRFEEETSVVLIVGVNGVGKTTSDRQSLRGN